MKVLITGSMGYIGTALMNRLSLDDMSDIETFPVDNQYRVQWVKEVGGESLTIYPSPRCFYCNLTDYNTVATILQFVQPDVILHLASQPSGPYSEISSQHRMFTQDNNIKSLEILLNATKDLLDMKVLAKLPSFIVTTTTGIPGAPGEPIIESHMQNLAGSEYHMTRGFDSANLNLASRQWGFKILELRTSIVYGTRVNELPYPVTRFDWDFYFGTAINRFCLSKKMNKPITIYGKGLQMKPVISLRDTVASLIHAMRSDIIPGHEIMNQTTECLSVVDMANQIGGEVIHIPNPRVEKEDYTMDIRNEKFLKLLNKPITKLKDESSSILFDIDTNLLPNNWQSVYDGRRPK